jgi:CDGSH-type Zn-finger protein
MADCTIRIKKNGSAMVSGSFVVEDVDGTSQTKPFCDGSHKAAGFESAPHVGDEG